MNTTWMMLMAALLLAFANGANDNFKGVATLYGSRTLSRRAALGWATAATLAGSLTAAFLATALARLFSGKGLVPDALVANPRFTMAVTTGAALTVWLAARIGMPVSTTHALVGALAGAGLMATGGHIHWQVLGGSFVWPLVASPVIALAMAAMLHRMASGARRRLGIRRETCVCLANGTLVPEAALAGTARARLQAVMPDIIVDDIEHCRRVDRYRGVIAGIPVQTLIEKLHVLSAGAVSFARGLNDTPKIVGVALAATQLHAEWLTFACAAAMAAGGLAGSRRVADTMSDGITAIEHGRGLMANLTTGFLVIVASRWGVPVSTTHVSCGAIFGIGAGDARTNWRAVRTIAMAWAATLPAAAMAAALLMAIA